MATIERYATASGATRYRVRYRTPERRQTDRRGFRTKRDAEQFAAQVETEKLTGSYVSPSAGRILVGDWAREWLAGRSDLRPSSLDRYEGIVRTHIELRWSKTFLSDIRPSEIQRWATDLIASGLAPASVRKTFRVLSLLLDTAVQDRLIVANPAVGIKIARPAITPRRYLTHRQVARLAEAAGPVGRPVIYVLAYCGLRWGEMVGLRASDISVARRRIDVSRSVTEVQGKLVWGSPKTRQRRSVPIPRFMAPIIAEAIAGKSPDDIAFPAERGSVMRYRNARRTWFDPAVVASGCPKGFHPHELRHTAASLAISAGANVKAVQSMLGHASAAMTLDTYADLFPDDLDDLAMRLDQAVSEKSVGKMWADGDSATLEQHE